MNISKVKYAYFYESGMIYKIKGVYLKKKTKIPTFCILLSVSSGAMLAGASSMIFWQRRWIEQSRVNTGITVSYLQNF